MTTRVTVDAHAGWPVLVVKQHGPVGAIREEVIVPAYEIREFYIHSGMKIINIEELPKEE